MHNSQTVIDCTTEIAQVLVRYAGKLKSEDGRNILCQIALALADGNKQEGAFMLHQSGMDLVYLYGVEQGFFR